MTDASNHPLQDKQSTRHLTNLYYLVRVVDAGSFAAAARELDTTRSLLSRRIIELETELGARLLFRNARHFAVTAVGERVYREAVTMCDAATTAITTARTTASGERGLLRINACDAVSPLLTCILPDFVKRYPQVQLTIHAGDDHVAALRHHADVTLHFGHDLPSDVGDDIAVTALGAARLVFVANPALQQSLPQPQTSAEVGAQQRLTYSGHGLPSPWPTAAANQSPQDARLTSGHITALLAAACAGMGFAQLPLYACHDALLAEQLQLVFPAQDPEPLPLHVLTFVDSAADDTVAAFIDFLHEKFTHMQYHGILPAARAATAVSR